MADDSTPELPTRSNNLLYGILGVLLFLLAIGGVVLVVNPFGGGDGGEQTVARPTIDAGPILERPTEDELALPELEPDAGPLPDFGPPEVRYVTRYAGGGSRFRCSGQLDRSAAARVVNEHERQFQRCYERRLKANPNLRGRLEVTMRIGSSGAVTGVQVGGSLRDSEVLTCVRGVAQHLRFPEVRGGSCAVVQAPLSFTPRN